MKSIVQRVAQKYASSFDADADFGLDPETPVRQKFNGRWKETIWAQVAHNTLGEDKNLWRSVAQDLAEGKTYTHKTPGWGDIQIKLAHQGTAGPKWTGEISEVTKNKNNMYEWEAHLYAPLDNTEEPVFWCTGVTPVGKIVLSMSDFFVMQSEFANEDPYAIVQSIANQLKDDLLAEISKKYPSRVGNTFMFYVPGMPRTLAPMDLKRAGIDESPVRVLHAEGSLQEALVSIKRYEKAIRQEDFGNWLTTVGVISWCDTPQWSAVVKQNFSRS